MPIQGRFKKETIGTIEVFPKYRQGLKDIVGISIVKLEKVEGNVITWVDRQAFQRWQNTTKN